MRELGITPPAPLLAGHTALPSSPRQHARGRAVWGNRPQRRVEL